MAQFAPIKEEIIPNQVEGIVGNIHIWDILSPAAVLDARAGFQPANMVYSFTDPDLLWTPNNSAFLSTFETYENFVTQKAIEFANQIPDAALLEYQPGQPIEKKIDWIKKNYVRFLPKFYFLDIDTLTINDIKFEYCRYNRETSEFLDCGVAEDHELEAMKTFEVEITFFPTTLGFGPYLTCEHCMGWVVACSTGFLISTLYITPSTKQVLERLEAEDVFYKKFKSFEEAKKFMEEENAKTKWVVTPFQQATMCKQACELCLQYNEDLVDCGPFDTRTECESCEERFYCDYNPETDLTACVLKTVAVGKVENPEYNGAYNFNQCVIDCSRRWYCRPNGDCEQLYLTGSTGFPELELPGGDTRYGYFLESACNEECTKAWFCIEGVIPFCDKLDKNDPAVEGLTPYETIEQCEEICGNPSTSSSSAI